MANRYRLWAIKALEQLKDVLGNSCAECGTKNFLEFDCIVPKGDRHHRFETNRRACFYRAQYKENNLQLLCIQHHKQKSRKEQYWLWSQVNIEEPF